jgi:hypothetical protein
MYFWLRSNASKDSPHKSVYPSSRIAMHIAFVHYLLLLRHACVGFAPCVFIGSR